ncbi:MAG: SDR family oxidoreductase, partial [Pseudomonadota bacterium]
ARLAGRTVILTGAAGNLGRVISQYLLREGANVVMTGRNREKLEAFIEELVAVGFRREAMLAAIGDCALPGPCREIVASTVERFGAFDVLVNNAGGAGPKQTLCNIPLTDAQARAMGESETMFGAAMNLLGGPWNMARAAVPHMATGGVIINVSTIFSRTVYFGRIPYVVPKSGLNAFSLGLAKELGRGEKGIRVNTVYPGPIESERIDTVFAAMDKLQNNETGTTSATFRDLMIAKRADDKGELGLRYPKPQDVANTILWLSSEESAAFSGQAFEITNGMDVPKQSRSKLVSWPDNRLVDLRGRAVLILGGADINEAVVFAERNRQRGADVVVGFRSLQAVGEARSRLEQADGKGVQLQHFDPLRAESADRVFQFMADHYGRLDGVIVLPATPNGQHGYSLCTADDEDVTAFVRDEIVAPVAIAAALSHYAGVERNFPSAPVVTYVTNPDDGHGN